MSRPANLTGLLAAILALSFPVHGQEERTDDPHVAEIYPEHLRYFYISDEGPPPGAASQLHNESKLWEDFDSLKICFYRGNPVVTALIAEVAGEWSSHSGIKLDFGENGAWRACDQTNTGLSQIRIGFTSDGYWSTIGTDSEFVVAHDQPSMNFEDFHRKYNPRQVLEGARLTPENVVALADPYHKGTILHEFGHALGLHHEHQNPALDCYNEIRWTGSNSVYDYYMGPPNDWDREDVDHNIGRRAFEGGSVGEADPKSIMMYAQPAAVLIRGTRSKCYVAPNNELSDLDKELISRLYPSEKAPKSETNFAVVPSLTAATIALRPKSDQNHYLDRIIADLNNDTTSARRNARKELAAVIEASGTVEFVQELVDAATEDGTYRSRLGVAVAISNAEIDYAETPELALALQSSLTNLQGSIDDPTLLDHLQNAKARVAGE